MMTSCWFSQAFSHTLCTFPSVHESRYSGFFSFEFSSGSSCLLLLALVSYSANRADSSYREPSFLASTAVYENLPMFCVYCSWDWRGELHVSLSLSLSFSCIFTLILRDGRLVWVHLVSFSALYSVSPNLLPLPKFLILSCLPLLFPYTCFSEKQSFCKKNFIECLLLLSVVVVFFASGSSLHHRPSFLQVCCIQVPWLLSRQLLSSKITSAFIFLERTFSRQTN